MASTKDMSVYLHSWRFPGVPAVHCVAPKKGDWAGKVKLALSFTLPWRGRVGSHEAKRNVRRGGVKPQRRSRLLSRSAFATHSEAPHFADGLSPHPDSH